MGTGALQGFSRVKLFPMKTNTTEAYEVNEGYDLPEAQSLTKETDSTETKIYADDALYLNLKSWNGLNTTITLAEMSLEMMAKLGFGTYNEDTEELEWNPQGKNLEFGMTFRCLKTTGDYRMYRMFSFKVNEVKESGTTTKGEGGGINAYQLIGTFTARKLDDKPGRIKDGEDMSWLDTLKDV